MSIVLNQKNPFENATNEEIAQFFITRVDLLPNYSIEKLHYNENGSIRAAYYEGSLSLYDPNEVDDFSLNRLKDVVKIISDAYSHAKENNPSIKGELDIYSNNGEIFIGITSWNKDATIDFNRKAALESMIKARQQAIIMEATQKLVSSVHHHVRSNDTQAKISFANTDLNRTNDRMEKFKPSNESKIISR